MSRTQTRALPLVALAALGVVFGDIGTSPLYALRETFHMHDLAVTDANVLGVLSIVLWSLVVIITVKYLAFVMRVDNHGEGGILALASLLSGDRDRRRRWALILLGVFGTALLYGDGAITPAISVLAAVEGVKVASPSLAAYAVPLAVVVLVALFVVQRRGTASIGRVFGPVMLVWFATLTALGLSHLGDDWSIFRAVNPVWAVRFFTDNTFEGFLALGSMFLVVTGGEALYADMGHFGRRSIRLGWYAVVLPALVVFYFGQGAMLLAHPHRVEQPFYTMAPAWAVVPLTVLATAATVIASQALITGVFSLTMQATQLGWLPRVRILHTSANERGQVYVPACNWALMAACIALVVSFGSSSALAGAYGLAVTGTMLITTLLFYAVARERLGWAKAPTIALCTVFGVVDVAFISANAFKFFDGGWFPLVVAAMVFTTMATWRHGRELLAARIAESRPPISEFLSRCSSLARIPGTGVYLSPTVGVTPSALSKNTRHTRVLPHRLVLVAVITDEVPYVDTADRATVVELATHRPHTAAFQVELHFGFMETPDVPEALREGAAAVLDLEDDETTYFLAAEQVLVTDRPGMAQWRERLFAAMSRNATPAGSYFNLPPDRVMTVGTTVDI